MGPAGQIGTLAWSQLVAAPQNVMASALLAFAEDVPSPTPAVTPDVHSQTVQQAGIYRITYSVQPQPGTASTTGTGSGIHPAFVVEHNGAALPATRRYRPMLNVNIALILTLKTWIDGAAVHYSGLHQLPAGAEISLRAEDMPLTNVSGSLLLERIG